jgi:hypothetical protein
MAADTDGWKHNEENQEELKRKKEKKMKRGIIIGVTLGLLGVLVLSGAALAFDPQPEPPGIVSKITDRPGVLTSWTFGDLFPFKVDGALFMPFGRLADRSFDPQPEPPGRSG